MNAGTVATLARAEMSLGRRAALGYVAAAALGAALTALPDPTARNFGVSLILCVLIGQCFHLPIVCVFHDLARGTRAFTLSLPVTPAEYAAGKILALGTLFLAPAGAAGIALAVTPGDERLFPPPLVALMLLGWLVFFCQNLGVSMVTESLGASVTALLAQLFMVGNGFMQLGPRLPWCRTLWERLESGGAAVAVAALALSGELALTVAVTLYLMNRKARLL